MTSKQTEALKMAIERLQISNELLITGETTVKNEQAIQACKEALEQPAQMYQQLPDGTLKALDIFAPSWQGLTWEEIEQIGLSLESDSWHEIARKTEQALKEKNHG